MTRERRAGVRHGRIGNDEGRAAGSAGRGAAQVPEGYELGQPAQETIPRSRCDRLRSMQKNCVTLS